ncbi:MAG: AbiV family abortive infection protein [Nitrososphaera sp.]
MRLSDTVLKTIREVREKTLVNAKQLLETAVNLFENETYPIACFLSMTAIEELGKLSVLAMAQVDSLKRFGLPVDANPEVNCKALNKFLRNHVEKAAEAAVGALYINSGADRRHGSHPLSGLIRTSGIILLARSGHWMSLRNNCLYTDINVEHNSSSAPKDCIIREHAYYFICMGFEILIEQAAFGLGFNLENKGQTLQFQEDRLQRLKGIMEKWGNLVNLDGMDFLANPEYFRKLAEERERAELAKSAPSSDSEES